MKTAAPWVLYVGMLLTMVGGAPWPRPRWALVGAGLAVIGAGIAMTRRAAARGGAEGTAAGSVHAAGEALAGLLGRVQALRARASTESLEAIAREVEALQTTGVEVVAASQEDFVRAHGFLRYASVMGPLATGERLLYRAWSAASDGHRPEVESALGQAEPYVAEAHEAMKSLR